MSDIDNVKNAIISKGLRTFKKLYKPKKKYIKNNTILILNWIISCNFKEALLFLLEKQKTNSQSAITICIHYNNIYLLNLLLNKYIDSINKISFNGYTPLTYACYIGNNTISRLLLNCNANPNTSDALENTPLSMAIKNNNFKLARILVKKGAIINHKNIHNETPVLFAAINNNIRIIQLFLMFLPYHTNKQIYKNALYNAIEYGNKAMIIFLIKNGITLN